MLKQLTIAAAMLITTGQALAHDYYARHGRVVTVEPSISFNFGGYNDGVGVRYHSGGSYYYDQPRYPVRLIGGPVYGGPVYYAPRAYGYKHRNDHKHRGHRHDGRRGHRD